MIPRVRLIFLIIEVTFIINPNSNSNDDDDDDDANGDGNDNGNDFCNRFRLSLSLL